MKQLLAVWEILEVILIACLVALLVRQMVQPFLVQGSSMEPNYLGGDFLLVDELTYKFRAPERGDVVVFHAPNTADQFYIKRVVGLPGEKVTIDNGEVKVNGELLSEKYLPEGVKTRTYAKADFTLTNSQYFVLGDNRVVSYDSRNWGPLSKDKIIGLVEFRLWPTSLWGSFTKLLSTK